MSGDLFRRDRPFHQLDGFYTEWSEHLTKNCIPLFRDFPPSDATNAAVLRGIHSYYDTIDHYADKYTILYFLFPSWRSNSLETPILFLGDIHPRLLTDLIQSLIDQDTITNLAAWEDLSIKLENTINGTVSRLLGEMKGAQDGFIKRFSGKWVSSFLGSRSGTVLMETATSVTEEEDGAMIMEELVRIFGEANQLRKDTITHIVEVLNMDQLALFLESVCKFLAGFKHQDKAFQNSLFGKNLIIQQLPTDDQLHDQPGEFIVPHQNYPPQYGLPFPPPNPMNQQHQQDQAFHNSRLFGNHPMIQYVPAQVPPHDQNYHQHMMQQQYGLSAAQFPPPNHMVPPMIQHQHVIYVGNLAPAATDDLLRQMFSRYNYSVTDTKICFEVRTGQKYGFVSFADEGAKWHAMKHMNRKMFLNREMYIGPAAKNSI